MRTEIDGGYISGEIMAVQSKSFAHRILIASALADTGSTFILDNNSDDIKTTCACLEALGAKIYQQGSACRISPISPKGGTPTLNCGDCGSALRFMLPLTGLLCNTANFQGSERLGVRPIEDLIVAMEANGCFFTSHGLPFTVQGKLQPGIFEVSGNESSQFVSALLMTLPLLEGNSEIRLKTPIRSQAYVKISLEVLKSFGITLESCENGFKVQGFQKFTAPKNLHIEGDWSNSAFFLSLGAIAGDVRVSGLNPSSVQGDREILSLLEKFGASPYWDGDTVCVKRAPLHGIEIDVSKTPDLLPPLAILGAAAQGTTVLLNAATLRLKESDRLSAIAALINGIGGQVREFPDRLEITGVPLKGGTVSSFGDHRIAMAAAIASSLCSGSVIIQGSEAVSKSYPRFFEDFAKLGANFKHFEGSNQHEFE